MNDALRRAMIAAGQDPDRVAVEASTIDLGAPRKGDRIPGPVLTLGEQVRPEPEPEQLGLDVGEATGIVTIRPGTKKHESLKRLRGTQLETADIEFIGEFKAAGLVRGGDTEGWTLSAKGDAALGMLDYGSIAKCEKGKAVAPETVAADTIGKWQREGQAETSRAAAIEAAPITGKARLAVLAFIHIKGDYGATDEEIETALRMNPSTVRPRRVELVEADAVIDSGRRRHTRAGRDAVVWIATEYGSTVATDHIARLQERAKA